MIGLTLAFEDANSKLLDVTSVTDVDAEDVVSVADVDAEESVDDSLVETLKLRFALDSEGEF